MKIGIFTLKEYSKSKDLPKFKLAGDRLGTEIEFINPRDICIKIENGDVGLYYKNGKKIVLDGAVNWIPYAKYDELSVAFDRISIPYINSVESVRKCRNKVLTNLILSEYSIPQPLSIYYPHMVSPSEIYPNIEYPFIYKRKSGSHGMGSQKFNDEYDVKNLLQEKYPKDSLYFQQYIKNKGYDYRILAVGNKVIGGIKKYYQMGEWRTHIVHGGKAEYYDVPDYIQDLCINILKALDLHFAGIDIMPDIDGNIFILEVNSVPGMSILYNLTNISMAEEILLHLKALIN